MLNNAFVQQQKNVQGQIHNPLVEVSVAAVEAPGMVLSAQLIYDKLCLKKKPQKVSIMRWILQ